MLAEELEVLDGSGPLWEAVRPFLDAALRLDQQDEFSAWHGWTRAAIQRFLQTLPSPCSLVVGVWEPLPEPTRAPGGEHLVLGVVCEVIEGEICSLRTFEALTAAGLKSTETLEPGYEDALEIMRAARIQVAPVAWALFTDSETWRAWVLEDELDGVTLDKSERLATFMQQGRCVLMGSQVARHRHKD